MKEIVDFLTFFVMQDIASENKFSKLFPAPALVEIADVDFSLTTRFERNAQISVIILFYNDCLGKVCFLEEDFLANL